MADVSKLRLDNVTYDIKDDNARKYLVMVNEEPVSATKMVVTSSSDIIELATTDEVSNAINTEASTRANDISAEARARETAIAAEASTRANAISEEASARSTAISNEASARQAQIAALQGSVGSPLVAATKSAMTNTSKIYVYTGSESGMTNGNWYYHNGSAWVSGGVYNATAVNTDKTLSVSNMAADAAAVGSAFDTLRIVNPSMFPLTITSWPMSRNGVNLTYKGNGVYHIQGTATASGFFNIIDTTGKGLPSTFKAGQKLTYMFYSHTTVTSSDLVFGTFSTTSISASGGWSSIGARQLRSYGKYYTDITIPSNSQGILCRFQIYSGITYNFDFTFFILNLSPVLPNFNIEGKSLALGENEAGPIDLNTLEEAGWWLLFDAQTYLNAPATTGFLCNIFTSTWRCQIMHDFSATKMWLRRGNVDGTSWTNWNELSGVGGDTYNITNSYDFPEYSQTVTLNATPSITTDTNNYLASTGDSTDRTAAILSMLTATGSCHLGPGVFYISGLQMPDHSTIIGSGYSTRIRMSGTSDGFAIKMGSCCYLKDFRLSGADEPPTFGGNIGGRHGVLWQGTYTDNHSAPLMGMISGLYIDNFTGGGITCYDTGYGTTTAIEGTNIYITNCWAGLNISYWSEFHKFTNVRCASCRIGCVNNGGNNIFVNCDFSTSEEIGMLMDNSQGQSPNHTHGSCIGCVFNHTRYAGTANSGTGIEMLNCDTSGFIFEGCQIFFSKINLVNCDGIVFSNCNFGNLNCDITISGGGAVLFNGNMHQAKPPITISNNTNVHFVNCYVKTTGAIVTP